MTITTATNKVMENVKEMKNYFIAEAMKSDMFTDMESNEMAMLWKMFKMLDDSMALMEAQAKVMDDLAEKMDKLVEGLNKE